ncbi:MAG: class I SAM-dependent methyltransferase [Pseudomonadota bacterium]
MDLFWTTGLHEGHVERIVQRAFRGYPGNLAVRLWTGGMLTFGSGTPDVTLVIRDPRLLRELILFRDPLRLAEAYFQGRLDVEGDLYAALGLKDHLQFLSLSAFEKAAFLFTALSLGTPTASSGLGVPTPCTRRSRLWWHRHSKAANRRAIAFHYDVSNAFYRLWLDEQMIYSCAYFETPDDSLDQAQRNKLEHICRKLRLKPGERLLDIGCGWGALIRWAARYHGVQAHGITLSRDQYDHCRTEIEAAGLQDQVAVEFRDYRDLQGDACYDKIVSVGMFEHVGLKNLPIYFNIAWRLLKPGGLFLNHGITHDREGWRKSVGTRFINRYVFPDGELDTVGNVQRAMERSDFEILDVEALRRHYALTLRHWVRRLESREAEAVQQVSEPVYRIWRLYMAACALQFERGDIGVYQILAARRDGTVQVPLTRRDLYVSG